MKLLALAAALSLITVPTSASADMTFMQQDTVFQAAKTLCPIADEATTSGKAMVQYLTDEADRRGYTSAQKLLLVGMCLMYLNGVVEGMRR